jgi:hypothetical protein
MEFYFAMKSTLWTPEPDLHLAAVMDAGGLAALPGLAAACRALSIESLTVYTQPPDLRLAPPAEATRLADALVEALEPLADIGPRLAGRRFYLPERLTRLARSGPPDCFAVRVAVDYASKPTFLEGRATLALVPDGLELGNLLRWHLMRTAKVRVDWSSFDAEDLATLLFDLPPAAVLSRASTPLAHLRRTWNRHNPLPHPASFASQTLD